MQVELAWPLKVCHMTVPKSDFVPLLRVKGCFLVIPEAQQIRTQVTHPEDTLTGLEMAPAPSEVLEQ